MPFRLVVFLALGAALSAGASERQIRLELVRESLTGTHCRYREMLDGIPTDDYVIRSCDATAANATAAAFDRARVVDGRVVRRLVVSEHGLEPWLHELDAGTGVLVRRTPMFFQKSGATPAFTPTEPTRGPHPPSEPALAAQPRLDGVNAVVFDPNPVAALNDPSLRDGNDAASAVPGHAYRQVVLTPSAPQGPLRGEATIAVDRQAPNVAPPDASASLVFDRGQDGFEDVNAFFHIGRNQAYLRELGYVGSRGIAPYPVEVDAHALGGADNSFFLPSLTSFGRGTLYFGEGGTDDAEDADLLVHEYGHAILEWIAPGTFGGAFSSEARALSEGFGDYWAYSAHRQNRLQSGRDPLCFADWDPRCSDDDPSEQCGYTAGTDCLRRLDSAKTMADYIRSESAGTEHSNGLIWSSALREIHAALAAALGFEEGRRVADTIVIESFFGAPPRPTYAAMARQLLEADRLLYGGAHTWAICAAMMSRGILASCGSTPRGELTAFQSTEHGVPIPENDPAGLVSQVTIDDLRAIERLLVRVDIEHPVRGDLRIDLVAPDGTTLLLQQVSIERAPGVHATFGLDADPVESLSNLRGRSAAGTWTLRVSDLRARDTGRLLAWGLLIQFAGEVPRSSRPSGGPRQMIPVVAHRFGANDTAFRSDVRLANPGRDPVRVTLVFTPSGEDGLTTFAAIDVVAAAGQTVALDDVVRSAFGTTGSGSLEVLGEAVVASRTWNTAREGSPGQQVPPGLDPTSPGQPPLYVRGLDVPGARFNLGVTETAGAAGIVRIEQGGTTNDLAIRPFSHMQFASGSPFATIRVIEGGARVVAYLSQIDNAGGDAMLIPALPGKRRDGFMAPALSAAGVGGTAWRSDLWSDVPNPAFPFLADIRYRTGGNEIPLASVDGIHLDVVGVSLASPGTVGALIAWLPAEMVVHTRIVGNGSSQYVPLVEPDGPALQHLVVVENAGAFRTNIGILASAEALAELAILDASGAVVERQLLWTSRGLAQITVRVPVTGGRAEVRFLRWSGRAWASLVDNTSKDGAFFVAP